MFVCKFPSISANRENAYITKLLTKKEVIIYMGPMLNFEFIEFIL